ncbi:MAG: N-acetylmuramoyl-L-alanine amidase [Candidatus Sulfobium sp.]
MNDIRPAGVKAVKILPAVLLAAILLFPAVSLAQPEVTVEGIRYWSYPDYTRLVVDLSGNTGFSKHRLSHPDRVFFDIMDSRVGPALKRKIAVGNGMLRSVRTSQFGKETVRVVLDLGKIRDYRVITLDDPARVVIDIYGHPLRSGKKIIVIDPGHGGHDPGAIGPNNLYEKDVVLDISLKLKKILSANPKLKVYLTRDKDEFIPLEERTAIANSKNADLFVSVHANASNSKDARGVETYFLNWTDNEEAIKVAARENQISLKNMKNMKKDNDVLDIMLGDLMRENKRDQSLLLANYIQKTLVDELSREYRGIVDLSTKWAPFYVLFGARMPSVLVEVSFISNPHEEKLLSRTRYREHLAKSIADGIEKYMSKAGPQTVAGVGSPFDSRKN